MIHIAPGRDPFASRPLRGALAFHGEWYDTTGQLARRAFTAPPCACRPLDRSRSLRATDDIDDDGLYVDPGALKLGAWRYGVSLNRHVRKNVK